MSRRASLPGANELFRTTSSSAALAEASEPDPSDASGGPAGKGSGTSPQGQSPAGDSTSPSSKGSQKPRTLVGVGGGPSGRQRHDEKITVYLSSDELVALDDAKGTLYRDLAIKVDRGRIVREAVAVVVADLQAKGEASILARRLREGMDA
jgi:hypothetical protein